MLCEDFLVLVCGASLVVPPIPYISGLSALAKKDVIVAIEYNIIARSNCASRIADKF